MGNTASDGRLSDAFRFAEYRLREVVIELTGVGVALHFCARQLTGWNWRTDSAHQGSIKLADEVPAKVRIVQTNIKKLADNNAK